MPPRSAARPLLVAHRAGNHIERIAGAEAAGVDLIEADLWLHRGRLEVRHSKTMGPVPLLWDRWMLASARAPRLTLATLLAATSPTTELMLDLKGTAAALPGLTIEAMQRLAPGRKYTVASQSWQLLEPFRPLPDVRVVHSVGSVRKLRALEQWLGHEPAEAVGMNHRLLTPARLDALRRLAPVVFTWTVNERTRAETLLDWGVDGLISDRYAALLSAAPASTMS